MAGVETEAAQSLIPFAASMGVGGILALVGLLLLRKQAQDNAETLVRLLETERLRGDRADQLSREVTQVVRDNSAVNARLCEKLDRVIDERSGDDRRRG